MNYNHVNDFFSRKYYSYAQNLKIGWKQNRNIYVNSWRYYFSWEPYSSSKNVSYSLCRKAFFTKC